MTYSYQVGNVRPLTAAPSPRFMTHHFPPIYFSIPALPRRQIGFQHVSCSYFHTNHFCYLNSSRTFSLSHTTQRGGAVGVWCVTGLLDYEVFLAPTASTSPYLCCATYIILVCAARWRRRAAWDAESQPLCTGWISNHGMWCRRLSYSRAMYPFVHTSYLGNDVRQENRRIKKSQDRN